MINQNIHPGCLCIIVGGRNAGRQCTAMRRITDSEWIPEVNAHYKGMDAWLIQGRDLLCQRRRPNEAPKVVLSSLAVAEKLMRIDDYDQSTDEVDKVKDKPVEV